MVPIPSYKNETFKQALLFTGIFSVANHMLCELLIYFELVGSQNINMRYKQQKIITIVYLAYPELFWTKASSLELHLFFLQKQCLLAPPWLSLHCLSLSPFICNSCVITMSGQSTHHSAWVKRQCIVRYLHGGSFSKNTPAKSYHY